MLAAAQYFKAADGVDLVRTLLTKLIKSSNAIKRKEASSSHINSLRKKNMVIGFIDSKAKGNWVFCILKIWVIGIKGLKKATCSQRFSRKYGVDYKKIICIDNQIQVDWESAQFGGFNYILWRRFRMDI